MGLLVFVTLLYQNGKMSLNSSSVMSIGPLIMFMLIIVMFISAISPNFNKISQGHVSSSFSNMVNLQNILMVIILIVTSMSTNTEEFKKKLSKRMIYFSLWMKYIENFLTKIIFTRS